MAITNLQDASFTSLCDRAIESLNPSIDRLVGWVEKLRPPDGTHGRFRWAVQSTRGANVAATAYLLGGFTKMGAIDRVIDDRDRREGIAWIRAMHRGNEQYHDPELLDCPTPGWPTNRPWPDPAMQLGVNQYAQNALRFFGYPMAELPPSPPPIAWPQRDDDPRLAVEWIKTRPWNIDAWAAGSHAMRMATWLLQWHKEGHIPLDPLIDALRFFYEIQNPHTGLWGADSLPLNNRINAAFKLFPLMREQLDLPLPHADRIIDQVMSAFLRPDYDATVGACDEWDNWYVIALSADPARGHRLEEIRKLAAYRIARVPEIFGKADGGLSYWPGACATNWIGYDMAHSIPQGDVMGPGILVAGISVCIDLAGLTKRTSWTPNWRMRIREGDALRNEILSRLDVELPANS